VAAAAATGRRQKAAAREIFFMAAVKWGDRYSTRQGGYMDSA